MICFKRCPYLRTVITEIIAVVWKSGRVPSAWKRACTILVHKKGNHDDPANFRPITLQSVPLKIFTSCLHDTIFSFLKQNGFVEQRIQKGFTHGVSGVLEHTSMMGHVINKARLKQRSVVIREITHSYDTATGNGKRSSPIVLRSTPWRFPAISRALKPVTHIIMCSVYFKGENLSVTVSALCF